MEARRGASQAASPVSRHFPGKTNLVADANTFIISTLYGDNMLLLCEQLVLLPASGTQALFDILWFVKLIWLMCEQTVAYISSRTRAA